MNDDEMQIQFLIEDLRLQECCNFIKEMIALNFNNALQLN